MCGIIGIVAGSDVKSKILEGLKRLEYRGYDSAGVAFMNNKNHSIHIYKKKGTGGRAVFSTRGMEI